MVVLGALKMARENWKPYAAAIFSQLQRASLSVQLNIAEGYAYANTPTFTRHLTIAYGSAVETGELLEIALHANLVPAGWPAASRQEPAKPASPTGSVEVEEESQIAQLARSPLTAHA